jgi:hypothetical protein
MNVGHQEVHKTSSAGGAMIVANFQAKEFACPCRSVPHGINHAKKRNSDQPQHPGLRYSVGIQHQGNTTPID